ncbi:MAG: folylpolyglutamate synthase/dihydrofolate synthase family protein [Candidatus Levybacteria bacterium]|nr:folylpolyglutamate synthase/dihydrofolate synthase family protein [Candidatus Levybacteria bacterium]
MKITTYQKAQGYLEQFIRPTVFQRIEEDSELPNPLDRMKKFLELLGNPQEGFRSILISGTSGKGSTAYLISHILKTSGYKTGLTISPHLEKINERIQINGKQISDKEFMNMVCSIVPTIELLWKKYKIKPSYFEILIALAFLYFKKEKVDIAVVEVGLEGKFDATNVLNPLIFVLTNIDLDHTEILGNSVEEIAKEATEIINKNKELGIKNYGQKVVVTGVKQKSVIKIVEEKCKDAGVELFRLGKDFSLLKNQNLSLRGEYQRENASIAVETVLKLKRFGFKIDEKNIRKALKTAFFPGRFEIVQIDSVLRLALLAQDKMSATLILDGAHNPSKMKAFIESLTEFVGSKKNIFVVAFKKDKDIKSMLSEIFKIADVIIITQFKTATDVGKNSAMPVGNFKFSILNFQSKNKIKIFKIRDSKKALKKAFEVVEPEDLIVVTGSLYLVGEIRSYLTSRRFDFGSLQKEV